MKKLFALSLLLYFLSGLVWLNPVYSAHVTEVPSEGELVLRILLKKGILTQNEYDEVLREIKETKEEEVQWQQHVDKHITHAEEQGTQITKGLSISGGITMVGQGTIGNKDNNPPADDVIDGNISADLEISASLGENGEAFIALEAGEGTGLDEELTTYWGFNADAGAESALSITEAWYEHSFADGMFTMTIGKLDLTNYFDANDAANDETTQFISDGFINNATIEFPENGPALRLTISPSELIDISLGAQASDRVEVWGDLDKKNFLIAETDFKPNFNELKGNYRLYVWANMGDHSEIADSTKDSENGSGFGISIDQQLTDYLTLFGRVGYRDKKIYEFDFAWSGGLAVSGSLWGRDNDVLAAAIGEAVLSNDQEDELRNAGTSPGNEGHFEAYYNLAINEHITISPDIQIITNAMGDDNFESLVVGAVRGQFTF